MKSKHTSHCLHLISILGILTTLLLCQRAQAETPQTINIKFRTYSLASEISDLSYGDRKQPLPVLISQKRRSKVMPYQGANSIVFYRKSELKEGQPIRPAAVVELRKGVRNPLLIFLKRPLKVGEQQTYDVCVIEDDPRDFSDGSMKFFNHTTGNLHLLIGHEQDTRVVVKPGAAVDYKLPEDFAGNLPIKIQVKKDEKFITVMGSRIFPEMRARALYFISTIPGRAEGNTVKIDTLSERGDVATMRLR